MFRSKMKRKYFFIITFVLVAYGASVFSVPSFAYEYSSLSRRDPFIPLVGVTRSGAKNSIAGILTIDDVSFQGILMNPGGAKGVIINGEIISEGQTIERLTVISVEDNLVRVSVGEEEFELKLYD